MNRDPGLLAHALAGLALGAGVACWLWYLADLP